MTCPPVTCYNSCIVSFRIVIKWSHSFSFVIQLYSPSALLFYCLYSICFSSLDGAFSPVTRFHLGSKLPPNLDTVDVWVFLCSRFVLSRAIGTVWLPPTAQEADPSSSTRLGIRRGPSTAVPACLITAVNHPGLSFPSIVHVKLGEYCRAAS